MANRYQQRSETDEASTDTENTDREGVLEAMRALSTESAVNGRPSPQRGDEQKGGRLPGCMKGMESMRARHLTDKTGISQPYETNTLERTSAEAPQHKQDRSEMEKECWTQNRECKMAVCDPTQDGRLHPKASGGEVESSSVNVSRGSSTEDLRQPDGASDAGMENRQGNYTSEIGKFSMNDVKVESKSLGQVQVSMTTSQEGNDIPVLEVSSHTIEGATELHASADNLGPSAGSFDPTPKTLDSSDGSGLYEVLYQACGHGDKAGEGEVAFYHGHQGEERRDGGCHGSQAAESGGTGSEQGTASLHSDDGRKQQDSSDKTSPNADTDRKREPVGSGIWQNQSEVQGRQPPMDGHSSQPTVRVALPNIRQEAVTPTRGGHPGQAGDTIISVPEGGGYTSKMTDKGMISVPGDEGRTHGGPPKNRVKPIECVIYFMDKTGLHLTVEDGQNAEAGELFEMVMDEMKFQPEARDVFSLWLVSDLLELQLKPHHIPFKLACYWEELLEKYTTASEEDCERDEPVIMFQRNCFYPRYKEKKLADPDMIRLLFIEAKENVIDARYPISPAEADKLAGLQALIGFKYFKADHHDPEYYKTRLTDFYPAHIANKRKWALPGRSNKDNPEYRLYEWHEKAFKKYGPIRDDTDRLKLHIKYLEMCWMLPYYGATFFRGQIEHPGSNFSITSTPDDPVYVAINPDGVFIIDMDDVVFLLGLLYEDMSWEYAEPKNRENPHALPCLFLQFKDKENGTEVTKVLQVFSREAMLMSAMIGACIQLRKANKMIAQRGDTLRRLESHSASDVEIADKQAALWDGDDDGVIEGANKESWRDFNRLCLQVFDQSGKCIKQGVRAPSSKRK